MPVGLYMDHHVRRAITTGLRRRGIDVLTAYEDGTSTLDDPALLQTARAPWRACCFHRTTTSSSRPLDDSKREPLSLA